MRITVSSAFDSVRKRLRFSVVIENAFVSANPYFWHTIISFRAHKNAWYAYRGFQSLACDYGRNIAACYSAKL